MITFYWNDFFKLTCLNFWICRTKEVDLPMDGPTPPSLYSHGQCGMSNTQKIWMLILDFEHNRLKLCKMPWRFWRKKKLILALWIQPVTGCFFEINTQETYPLECVLTMINPRDLELPQGWQWQIPAASFSFFALHNSNLEPIVLKITLETSMSLRTRLVVHVDFFLVHSEESHL